MKRKKIILYSLLGVLLLAGAAAWYIYREYNRGHKDTADLRPDFRMEAPALVAAFNADEKSSGSKYWDKVITVEGMVKEISKDEQGRYTIVLGDTASNSSVRCSIDSMHISDIQHLVPLSRVHIKGICSGYNADELLGSDVFLVRSVLDKAESKN